MQSANQRCAGPLCFFRVWWAWRWLSEHVMRNWDSLKKNGAETIFTHKVLVNFTNSYNIVAEPPPPPPTHIYIHTLTGHFIMYTLLVPGWTHFCLQNCLHSLWHRFNKVLETFLRDGGPYWHDSITQLLQICRLHIHDVNLSFHHIPKCSIGLRSGDCGGHLSKVNSLSCSRNQSEMIWALWHGALSCWKYIRRWVHCSHKGMDMVSNNTQVGCGI